MIGQHGSQMDGSKTLSRLSLIPCQPTELPGSARAIYPSSTDRIFNAVVELNHILGESKGYPYCKLDFIQALWLKSHDSAWICDHTSDLVVAFFSLILNKTLLFSQTRELTSSATTVTYRTYMTNLADMKLSIRKDIVKRAIEQLQAYFDGFVRADDTGLSKQEFDAMLDLLWNRLCPAKGRAGKLIEFPIGLEDALSYRDIKENQDLWRNRRSQDLYLSAKIFGDPAPDYYEKYVSLNIAAIKSCYGEYKPYFLTKQWDEFQEFQRRGMEDSEKFHAILRLKGSDPFRDKIPLPNKLSLAVKVETFSYKFFTYHVADLNGYDGKFDMQDHSLTVDLSNIGNDSVVLHEMIHLHEFVINDLPMIYHDAVFYCLYKDLASKIPNLNERIEAHGHILNSGQIARIGGVHDILFLLKSFDLDLEMGYKLGTVFGYGMVNEWNVSPGVET